METTIVKNYMVPVDQYATVSEEATLYEAVLALEQAQIQSEQLHYKHRGLLILDRNQRVVGKLGHLDVLKGLEPKYQEMGDISLMSRFGFSASFIKDMAKGMGLLEKPLEDICKKAARVRVKDIMHTPRAEEYIDQNTSLNLGIHQLITGSYQSLLVTRDKEVVGILRLSDVYLEVSNRIKVCEL